MLAKTLIQICDGLRSTFPNVDMDDREVVIANFSFLYDVIVASEGLCEEAIALLPPSTIRSFYEDHLLDERHHAAWLRQDLEGAGWEKAQHKSQAACIIASNTSIHLPFSGTWR